MARTGEMVALHRVEGRVEELTDAALVASCGTGDTAALGALYDRYHAQVFRVLSRVARSMGDEVDDLVQATFIEVLKSAHRYRGDGEVRSWIMRIAVNVARRQLRGRTRRKRAMEKLALEPVGPVRVPRDEVAGNQFVDQVWDAMGRLSHDRRVAFVLCDLEGMSGVEAARALDIRPGTLWRRLHEARKTLRAALEVTRV